MTLKQFKTYIILFALSLLLNSCASLSYIEIDALRPAKYTMAPDILSIVAVDYSYPYRSDSMHVIHAVNDTLTVDSIWIDDFGLRAVQSMANSLKQQAFFDSVYFHPRSLNRPPNGNPNRIISVNEIRNILEEYNAQALITLERTKYTSQVKIIGLGSYYYHTTLDVVGELFWKIYDKNGYILDVYLQNDTLFWEHSPFSQQGENKELPHIKDAVEILAKFMGQEYPTRIAPYWEAVYRPYYRSGHHMFDRANDLVYINNWNQAGRVWYYIYENGNRRQKARAAFNLALAFEVSGNFEESLAWAEISSELMGQLNSFQVSKNEKELVAEYVKELQQRIEDSGKLQEQLGGGF